jgi:hypothetical protein
VAVTAADVTAPTGELNPDWFSSPDLPTAAAVWIGLGEELVPGTATSEQADAVVTAYTYVRAYGDLWGRMLVDPNSVSIDKGDLSIAFAADQRAGIKALINKWQATYDALLEEIAAGSVEVAYNPPRASYSQAAIVSF